MVHPILNETVTRYKPASLFFCESGFYDMFPIVVLTSDAFAVDQAEFEPTAPPPPAPTPVYFNLLTLFNRSSLQVLQSDGGNLPACINAATLALIDAGIPMKDYVSACAASFIDDTALVDSNMLEENSNAPKLTLASLPKSDKMVLFQTESRLHIDNLGKIFEAAKKGCVDISVILQRTIKEALTEHMIK